MNREIVWKGNNHTNSSSRGTHVPFVIVNHISAGTMASMDSWFTSPGNKTSSAHFGVAKDGRIHQYVDIRRMAWANGIGAEDIAKSKTPVIQDNPGINPNLYSVSIEHEGTDGDLTEAQFQASVWLHRYIQQQVQEIWGRVFELDRYHVIGHFQVNPRGKPSCPGSKFPWNRLYKELLEVEKKEDDTLKLETWQWKMLGDTLDGLYRKGVIGDYSWAEKAYTGKLTASELAWLNTVIFARQAGVEV
ncbi:N-acetylmuramoyl-L-alanine amidase [Paenibacillus residui]|uniref:N-acetylmuramoyl-L-alanine amidase n=1 Tax=Paenibacillus residui TaxID=629724 RepID=A0ABW3D600_9BACL